MIEAILWDDAGTIEFYFSDIVWVKKFKNYCEVKLKNGDVFLTDKDCFLVLYKEAKILNKKELNQ